jgi:hypothetical protein
MDPMSGRLLSMAHGAPIPTGYLPVPKELEGAATKKLAGRSEAYVSPSSGGKLSKWARSKRKMVKSSKKKNRA